MKNIVLQNISPYRQTQWVFVATKEQVPLMGKFGAFDFYKAPHGLYLLANLAGGEGVDLAFDPNSKPAQIIDGFQFASWVADDLNAIIPYFSCDGVYSEPMYLWDGSNTQNYYFKNISADLIKQVWYFKTQIISKYLTIEGWVTFYHNQDVVEFSIHSTYGTVTSPNFGEAMGTLLMYTGEVAVVDYAKRKGLTPTQSLNGKWVTPVAQAGVRGRAQRIEATGAFLCLPKLENMSSEFANPKNFPRIENLFARQIAPICGVSKSWRENKEWLVFGETPLNWANQNVEINRARNAFISGLNTAGNEYDQRPYASQKWSGTSGDHEDFGASKGQLAVSMDQAWSIWDVRYSCQQWALRPTGNKEANGDRVLFANHPQSRSYEQGIDPRFSASDMLGWPNPTPWERPGSGATTLDEQHRTDNNFFATYALTRDPSLESIIRDWIELDRMDQRVMNNMTTASRAIGRLLMSKANQIHLGFPEATASMMATFNAAYQFAHFRGQPLSNPVKVINVDNPAKYGWVDANGTQIAGWVAWQESIALMGFYAVYKVTNDPRCLELIEAVSRTIINHAFFKIGNDWGCAYSVRWNSGQPLPESSYNYNQPNYDIAADGIVRWTIPAVKLHVKLFPSSPDVVRANEILAALGNVQNVADATWWAI